MSIASIGDTIRAAISRFRLAAVALAVGAVLAACAGGGSGGQDGDADGAATGGDRLEVVGTDGRAFEPERATVAAGDVTIELTSEPAVPHTFNIEELDDVQVVMADGGETATGTIGLEPGTYTFCRSIPGHRQAGMEGTLAAG